MSLPDVPDGERAARSILLVGAYANGNIGDMLQADALASELRAVDPSATISSASPSKLRAPYPAVFHERLDASILEDPERLNAFDLILVGGGGLLAAPHWPLHDDAWVSGITTRLCAVGLGCAATAAIGARSFVERCDVFSVRDEHSAAEVAEVRADVSIVMDPILLCEAALGEPAHDDDVAARAGVVCIAGKLLPTTTQFYERLEQALLVDPKDEIVSINPATDRRSGFDEVFIRQPQYVSEVPALHRILCRRRLALSERYHGCIFALRWRVPCYGITLRSRTVTSKIAELYRRLDLSDLLIQADADFRRGALVRAAEDGIDFDRIGETLAGERAQLREYLRRCLAPLDPTSP